MTHLDLIALALQTGDKVHLMFAHTDKNGKENECDAIFGGYRHYGKGIIRDFYDILPIFYEINNEGKPTRRLLHGMTCWSPSSFLSIKRLAPINLTADAVNAICDLKGRIDHSAHELLTSIMKDYAKCHPGRPKVYFDPDDTVSAEMDGKYCSYSGTVNAISFNDGMLCYDISTQIDFEKDVPDYREVSRCGVFVEDETYLLKILLNSLKKPYFPSPDEDEDFFNYIKPGAKLRWNDSADYNIKFGKPGWEVEVIKVMPEDEVIEEDTPVVIIPEYGNTEITVKAKELEPLTQIKES